MDVSYVRINHEIFPSELLSNQINLKERAMKLVRENRNVQQAIPWSALSTLYYGKAGHWMLEFFFIRFLILLIFNVDKADF